MILIKKISFVVIFLLFLSVLFYLFDKRYKLGIEIENYTGMDEMKKIKLSTSGYTIPCVKNLDLPLKEYCIKSSYNSALSGNYVSTDMIKNVLSRGCRFLDFEIFYIDNNPCVAYSTDPTFVTITSKNFISLNDVLKAIIVNGFSGPSPNANDPLFIHFRIKSQNSEIYNKIGMRINNYLSNRLYNEKIDGSTQLSLLIGHVILIIDVELSSDYNKIDYYPNCSIKSSTLKDCFNLSTYSNIESGTKNLRIYDYDNLNDQTITPPVLINQDGNETDVSLFRIVVPNNKQSNNNNPTSRNFIQNYGVQFVTNCFYKNDSNLIEYEKFFFDNKSAFVPFASALRYYNKLDTESI